MWLKGSYKTRKNNSDFREVPPWWVPHWVKFEAKYEANNVKLNYLKWIAINRTIQPLLLNINKWNLKVLISDLLFFVFQFHICLPNCGFGNKLNSPPKIKVSCKFKKIFESFLVRKFCSACINLFMADSILLADTPSPDLT